VPHRLRAAVLFTKVGAESTPQAPVSAFLTDVLLIAVLIAILDALLIAFLIAILDVLLIAFLIAFLDVVAVSVSVLVRLLTDVLVAHVKLDDGRAARLTSGSR
jgi:uncharacterized membrane protein